MGVLTREFAPRASSSEDYDAATGACSIEFYHSTKDRYRVGPGSHYTIPWPFNTEPPSSEARALFEDLRPLITQTLKETGLDFENIFFHRLSPQSDRRLYKDTFVITTTDENVLKWDFAATLLQERLDIEIRNRNYGEKMRVEIRNTSLMYKDISSAVLPNTPDSSSLRAIRDKLEEAVPSICGENWAAISYTLRGPAEQLIDRIPTVMVYIPPKTRSLWEFIEKNLKDVLESTKDPIALELVPGGPQFCLSEEYKDCKPLPLLYLPKIPTNGASIGSKLDNTSAGSLGVFVSMRKGDENVPEKGFITCYHVISQNHQNRKHHDKFGIGLDGEPITRPITVEYPSNYDAAVTIPELERIISSGEDSKGKFAAVLKSIKEYASGGGLGNVVYASGYQRANERGHRMDWAIVKLKNQELEVSNSPVPDKFNSEQLPANGRYEVEEGECVTRITDPKIGAWVAKHGRTTGATAGILNDLETCVHWGSKKKTREYYIENQGAAHMVNGGDSGSMVINQQKEWVGTVIQKLDGGAIITSAREIIEDVRETTGIEISLL